MKRNGKRAWLALGVLVVAPSCSAIGGPAASPLTSVPGRSDPTTAPSRVIAADGRGWTGRGLDGPVPPPGSCTYRRASDGYLRPDPVCTPGAIDPSITQSNLTETVCRSGGYTSGVRPPESMTEPFKLQVEAAYRDPDSTSDTELDHLVPLELAGASDTRNLWPQPDQGQPAQFDRSDSYGANAKDGVEDRLHEAVCDGQVSLAAAQAAIASDWTTAESRLGVSP